ncbi:putative membrane protein [uncultured Paludibacter sp.]|uniref:Putative membrane protein n=1 Tax=uncultured Paludibacter sp. TaxID=497635 RepID=A0A653AGG4_9BACT|nr:putative membrane protein [uncultured Paludibacter sp.]
MKKRISVYIYIILSLIPAVAFSQSDISMATQWYNRGNYNPASIARTDYAYLFANTRKQWLGVEGSPTIFNVQASMYNNSLKSAFGVSIVNDVIGITNSFNPMFSYAYRISNDPSWALSFGLSLGIFNRTIDISRYSPVDDNDQTLYQDVDPETTPDANFGVEFQNKHFIFGASTTHLFSMNKPDSLFLNANHRYVYGIYKNTNSELFNYYLGLQMVNHYNIYLLESNAVVRFKVPTGLQNGSRELFDIGLKYRSSKQMTALFGINITNSFRIGYAFDQTLRSGYNQNGTHEIMLEYRIPLKSAECEACRDQELWYR